MNPLWALILLNNISLAGLTGTSSNPGKSMSDGFTKLGKGDIFNGGYDIINGGFGFGMMLSPFILWSRLADSKNYLFNAQYTPSMPNIVRV